MGDYEDRAEVLAELVRDMEAAGIQVPAVLRDLDVARLQLPGQWRAFEGPGLQLPAPSPPVLLDEMDRMLTIPHTLDRFAEITTVDIEAGEMMGLDMIAEFVATLTEDELLAISELALIEAVAAVTLAHLPLGQRTVIVRGLQRIADAILDLGTDLMMLAADRCD